MENEIHVMDIVSIFLSPLVQSGNNVRTRTQATWQRGLKFAEILGNQDKSTPKSFGKSASLSHNYATKSPLVTMRQPKFTPKLPLPFNDYCSYLIHPSFDRPHSPSKTPSGSTQPFCQSRLSGHTDRQTLAILIESNVLVGDTCMSP